MTTRRSPIPSEPPTFSPEQAIQFLRRQLERMGAIQNLPHNDPKIEAWESTTRDILDKTFGKPNGSAHRKTDDVMHASRGNMWINMPSAAIQKSHLIQCQNRRALMEAYIEQLSDGLSPSPLTTPNYGYHPEIMKVSFALLNDGHYKQAALEAYICVIHAVKEKSSLPNDGDSLMNVAFGCDGNRIPPLKFNSLSSDSERDEQRGIMYLFKGIVGLRNAKAHSNTLFSDPNRAHEYLALASLLMRLLDIVQT